METSTGRLILYVELKKQCAAGQTEAIALLRREMERELVQYPEFQRATIVQGFLDRFDRGLAEVGLHWDLPMSMEINRTMNDGTRELLTLAAA